MLNLNSILLFSEQPKALTEFYKKILGKPPEWNGGEFTGFKVGTGYFMIGPHDKVKGKSSDPERMMFNFETQNVQDEFENMKRNGAGVVANPYHPMEDPKATLATLSDPDGNYFQLITPMK